MNIKDFLRYYIGCRVLVNDKDLGTFLGAALVPNEVDQIYYDIHLDEWPEGEIMPFNDDMSEDCRIKPILRRLEDMTEEERKHIWLMLVKRPFPSSGNTCWFDETSRLAKRCCMMSGVDRVGIEMNGHVWWDCDLSPQKYNPHFVTHYLLKRGFDLFGLCDAGLAIDSKTVNQ